MVANTALFNLFLFNHFCNVFKFELQCKFLQKFDIIYVLQREGFITSFHFWWRYKYQVSCYTAFCYLALPLVCTEDLIDIEVLSLSLNGKRHYCHWKLTKPVWALIVIKVCVCVPFTKGAVKCLILKLFHIKILFITEKRSIDPLPTKGYIFRWLHLWCADYWSSFKLVWDEKEKCTAFFKITAGAYTKNSKTDDWNWMLVVHLISLNED